MDGQLPGIYVLQTIGMYRVIEREKYAPDYKYEEEYENLSDAKERMRQLYHETAIEGDPDLIEKAEIFEMCASVIFVDGNEVTWDIED